MSYLITTIDNVRDKESAIRSAKSHGATWVAELPILTVFYSDHGEVAHWYPALGALDLIKTKPTTRPASAVRLN